MKKQEKNIDNIIKEICKNNPFENKNSKEFDRQRQIANNKILDKLKKIINSDPGVRFIQALWGLHIIDRGEVAIIDRFYEEPQDTLERIAKYEK